MKEKIGETPKVFKELIPLNKKMTPQEAIARLVEFHGTNPESVLGAFVNLQGFEEGAVEFAESVNNSYPCISMRGYDSGGNLKWNHLIDQHSGQPQMRCG